MPYISIILPVYNSNSEWLSQSIESVLGQSYSDFELIIINDCSTNDIEKTILKFTEIDERIIYSKNEVNIKLTKTLNRGLEIATGKYIARIDDDDIWVDPNKLQKQIDFLDSHREYGICGTNIILENIQTGKQEKVYMQETDSAIRGRMLLSTQFSHSSIMFRKDAVEDCGPYNPNFNLMEDHELRLRIGKKYKLYNLQDFTTLYRVNPQGVSLQNRKKQHRLALKLCLKYKKDYPGFMKAFIGNIVLNYMPKEIIRLLNKLNRFTGKPIV